MKNTVPLRSWANDYWPLRLWWCLLMVLIALPVRAEDYSQSYTDDLYGFHLSLPNSEWSFNDLAQGRSAVKVKINYHHAIDQFVPNITLSVSEVEDKDLTFDCILEKTLAAYPKDLSVQKQKAYKLGGRKVADITLASTKLDLLFLQRLILKDQRLFVLTYSAKTNSFERFLSDAKRIFDSILFINKGQKSI